MKTLFVGVVVVIVGIFLPWATEWVSSEIPNLRRPHMSASGFQINQGIISAVLTVVAAVLGVLSARMTISGRFSGVSAILVGVVVIMMGITSLDSKTVRMGSGARSMTAHSRPELGVPVTIFGGAILLIGGIIVFRK